MRLAGLDITDDCTLELVRRLRRADFTHQADTIEGALVSGQAEDELAHGREGMSQPFHCLTPRKQPSRTASSPLRSRLSARGRS
jgi:hypothetical protein